jgi:hypothetical protein
MDFVVRLPVEYLRRPSVRRRVGRAAEAQAPDLGETGAAVERERLSLAANPPLYRAP